MKIIITGDSHTGPLLRGKSLLIKEGGWPDSPDLDIDVRPFGSAKFFPTPFFKDEGEYAKILNPVIRQRFQQFPLPQAQADVYGFSGFFSFCIGISRNRAWSRYVPTHLVNDEFPVSRALLQQVVMNCAQYLFQLTDIVHRTTDKFFVIESPRPFRNTLALKHIRPEVLIDVDRQCRDIIHEQLGKRGIPVISVDTGCLDDMGFMLDAYRSGTPGDQHHGNGQFGKMMMAKTLCFIEQYL